MLKAKILYFIIIISSVSFGQQTVTGRVLDATSGELIIGAIVYDVISNNGTRTNNQGYFSLKVESKVDTLKVRVSMLGYKSLEHSLDKDSSSVITIRLFPIDDLNVVTVYSESPIEKRSDIGVVKIPSNQIRQLPSISGEFDILRAYQLMPGVGGGKEGTSGIYVRGGSPDQNLFIIDDIPLYYVSHIGGFVSVFDINAINDMTLYKGGFPSKYGGRISSVMDFQMKEGNSKKITGEIGLGIVSTKVFIEGPIKKDTTTFFLSARRSNLDLFSRPITLINSGSTASSGYTFYDVNTKISHKFKNGGKLQLSGYIGRDKLFVNSNSEDEVNDFKYEFDNHIKWGNFMGQIKYSKLFHQSLFMTTTLGFTQFYYNTDISSIQKTLSTGQVNAESAVNFISGVFDFIGKTDFEYYLSPSNTMRFGAEGICHFFRPGISSKQNFGNAVISDSVSENNRMLAQEVRVYFQDEIKIRKRIKAILGFHFSSYFVENRTLNSIQPRVLISFLIFKRSAIKVGYSRMNQNIHLLTNSGTGLPTDLWVPATIDLPSEISDQYNISYTQSISKSLEISVDGYWKRLQNLVDYKEGTNYLGIGNDWQSTVEGNGKGEIYGFEVLLRKRYGKFQGWLGYSWSKNKRQFDNINDGQEFYYKFDKRHDISVVGIYQINKKITLSFTWLFNSGNPITLAQQKYDVLVPGFSWTATSGGYLSNNLNEAHIYQGKNAYRLPAYHKLDVGVSFKKVKAKGTRVWSFGLYNVYNKQNPFFLYYKKENEEIKLYQLSLFPIIPSFSYTFNFN